MIRYFRLYLYFLRFSFSKAMQFRLDFFFRVVMDLLFYMMNLAFFNVLFLHTDLIGGWRLDQMRVFVCGYLLLDSLNMTIFANNAWWFPVAVNKGDLDYYLMRPVSPLFFLSLREFAANSFLNLIMAASLFAWSINQYQGDFTAIQLLVYLFFLCNGTVLYYLTQMFFYFPIFWTQSPRGLGELFYGITAAIERPDRIYQGWVRILFITVLPFTLMASFPARLFLEGIDWRVIGVIITGSAVTWTFFLIVWKMALRAYSSASS